jgi:hypothetical protein
MVSTALCALKKKGSNTAKTMKSSLNGENKWSFMCKKEIHGGWCSRKPA